VGVEMWNRSMWVKTREVFCEKKSRSFGLRDGYFLTIILTGRVKQLVKFKTEMLQTTLLNIDQLKEKSSGIGVHFYTL
jgi:hypothetical protein